MIKIITSILLFTALSVHAQWNKAFVSPRSVSDLAFVNDQVAIAAGTVIYRTTDGGKNWSPMPVPNGHIEYHEFSHIEILSPDNILLFGNELYKYGQVIYRTRDTCKTFERVYGEQASGGLNAVFFSNHTNGIAAGQNGNIIKTSDGGSTWVKMADASSYYGRSNDMKFTDANTGYIANTDGYVLKTTNGGLNWKEVLYKKGMFTSIVPLGDSIIIAAGWNFDTLRKNGGSRVMLSRNQGLTWTEIDSDMPPITTCTYDKLSGGLL